MDTNQFPARTSSPAGSVSRALHAVLIVVIGAALLVEPVRPTTTSAAVDTAGATPVAAATNVIPSPPVAVTSFDDRGPDPDATAEFTGGAAARLHTTDDTPVPGDVFLLMATPGSDATARLYDHTPYTHHNGTAADTHDSNLAALTTVETITGTDIDLLELTTAPGGGPSGGITYTIAYLNVTSNGAFTGNLRIAATGRIDTNGYVNPINAINEKTAAAHLAAADVLFTPSTPTDNHLDTYAARHVGERTRARNTGNPLTDERQLDHYHTWGTTRPDGMDIIHVRHIADIAAYLCGTGSTYACHITQLLEHTTTEYTTTEYTTKPHDTDQSSHEHMAASLR